MLDRAKVHTVNYKQCKKWSDLHFKFNIYKENYALNVLVWLFYCYFAQINELDRYLSVLNTQQEHVYTVVLGGHVLGVAGGAFRCAGGSEEDRWLSGDKLL